ncbi:hypothetical protein KEM09_08805 [Carboxylicivirga mesophila]|uniref:Alpha-L-glutamate ligase-related protein ATP-grasp domain-containing protein n=1 Tax=Carboxylicivirga mesophila TaxID=1166478 RepID=A0ABS5K918_9BACT|nr:hypothetical protein [Carboxylicivirga mesophila]
MKTVKKIAGFFYRVTKKTVKIQSWYLHHFACYLNGRRVWKRIKKKQKQTNVEAGLISANKAYWKPLCSMVPQVFIKEFTALTGIKSELFVPENIYFTTIEPLLNNASISSAYEDKAIIDWMHSGNYFPKIFIRNIHGTYYSEKGEVIQPVLDFGNGTIEKVVVKPSVGSQGGKNIYLFEKKGSQWICEEGHVLSIEFMESRFGMNFIVQEYIHQHPFFSQFNPSSVNTLRVMTYRSVKNEQIHVIQVVLRVGKDGSVVDNQSSGGYVCGIGADGCIRDYAINKKGDVVNKLAKGRVNLLDKMPVHMLDDVKQVARQIARRHVHSRLLGFDFCVDKDEQIKLIEVNNMDLAIDFIQQVNGPLFGEFTQEIRDYCLQHKHRLKHRII